MSSTDPYGVWYGNPVSYTQQTDAQDSKSPHITLKFTDSSSSTKQAAINVQSTGSDTRLVYWFNRNWTHPITKELGSLSLGFHQLSQSSTPPALDYWRTTPALFDFSSGQVLATADTVEPDLDPIIQDAIDAKAKMYIFGESYGTGIHDIHCNQGDNSDYENSTYKGGALVFGYSDGHFESVFLAFASQKKPTNDQGQPTADSQTLAALLGASADTGSDATSGTTGSGVGNAGRHPDHPKKGKRHGEHHRERHGREHEHEREHGH